MPAALARAGLTLFSQHPVDALSLDDIVREAGVGKGSFYTYFADKDALLAAIVEGIRARIEEDVTRANRDISDPASRVARGLCCYLRYVAKEPEQGAVLTRNDRRGSAEPWAEINRGTEVDIASGLDSRRFSAPSVEAGALLVVGAGFAGVVRVIADRDAARHLRLAQQLCQLVLKGLGLPQPEAEQIADEAAKAILATP